ncbi:MAG: YeiH family putative sulfate export transporter [bacterium]|nr:YeiH family putative sulfate export transporter [bacterium]
MSAREPATRLPAEAGGVLPGLALTAAIAALAVWLHGFSPLGALSPLILAIALGTLVRNTIGTPAIAQPGVTFSLKRVLRLAIVLLGLQLSLVQVAQVGARGLIIVIGSLVATFLFTQWAGRRLGIDRRLAQLIAAGTSICGASAVIATNVVTEGRDEDVAYAVAMVTVFGGTSMFLYPLLPGVLHLSPQAFGVWAGASIHEIAQVVAAAFQDGKTAGEIATISKLTRVMMLAPVIVTLGMLAVSSRRKDEDGGAFDLRAVPIPWFVLGFVVLIVVNSFDVIPQTLRAAVVSGNQFLLALALAAMGLETSVAKLRREGLRPFVLGALAWIFIAAFSLALVRALY